MTKGERREAKRRKAQFAMKVTGRSIITVLIPLIIKRGKATK